MLVVAPLRVARQTWPDEIAKWEQFSHLRVAVLHGPKKDDLIKAANADVYLINPEGIFWLCNKYFGRPLPFDVLVIDELTKFKNASSERVKRLLPRLRGGPKYRWGLTGSLAGDGKYEDVFGQQLMLDDGAALGRYVTHFRDKYFTKGYDGFSLILNRGAEQKILERLAPYWFFMDPADYSQLPALVDNPIMLDMSDAEMAQYKRMREQFIASLSGKTITAANAGGAYGKLAQMANGAVYDGAREVHKLHDLKLDALEDLVAELNGEPLLVGYEFNHDLTRLRERFGADLPYLGNGTTKAQEKAWIAAWNAGKLPILAGHPASMGHGLNLQEGHARHICHFSLPWSWELYDQFTRRIRRSGNEASTIFNHMLIVRGTIDEDKLAARDEKSFTHGTLMRVLNEQILREGANSRTGAASLPAMENDDMVARLSRPGQAAPAAPASAPAQAAPSGWGAPPAGQAPQAAPAANGWGSPQTHNGASPPANGWGAPGAPDPAQTTDEQRERIRQTIAPPAEQVAAAFGAAAQQQAAAVSNGDYGAPTQAAPSGWGTPPAAQAPQAAPAAAEPRKRRTKEQVAADEAAARAQAPQTAAAPQTAPAPAQEASEEGTAVAAVLAARVELLKLAFADPNMPMEEGLQVADELWKWVNSF